MLYISDEGEIKECPEFAGKPEGITVKLTRPSVANWPPDDETEIPYQTIIWRRLNLSPELEHGIVALIQQRDKVTEQVEFLVGFIEDCIMQRQIVGPPMSEELSRKFESYHRLWRELKDGAR